jgi:hypothetical protein
MAAVGLAASFVLAATLASTASAHAAKPPTVKHLSCLQRFPTQTMSQYTGAPMAIIGHVYNNPLHSWEYKEGSSGQLTKIGSLCFYQTTEPVPASWPTNGYPDESFVELGYDANPKLWGRFTALYRSNDGAFDGTENYPSSDLPTYSPVALGYGSKAFLLTFDQWTYQGYDAADADGYPEYLYAVVVLSRRHSLLLFAAAGLSATQTKSVATGLLKTDF